MGRILGISNQKGGVGKTTTAVNLAASLGAAERKILLVDVDPQANATSGLGLNADDIQGREIYQVLLEEIPARNAVTSTAVPNVDILPATADLIGFEVEAIDFPDREHRLKKALAELRDFYDALVIDCPPSLSLLTLNALTAADGVLIPLQCEYYALEGLSRLLHTLDLVRAELNPTLALEGILLTMFDRRNNLSHQVAQEVEKHFSGKLLTTRIPRNIRLSEAPSFGKPILLYDIRCSGAQSYLALAEELLRRKVFLRPTATTDRPDIGGSDDRAKSLGAGPVLAHSNNPTDGH